MRIAIGSDHAGFELKQQLGEWLRSQGFDLNDVGTSSPEPVDYPEICADVASRVRDRSADLGIVLGGSGQGEAISANKVHGVRAALCNDLFTARLAREHNDANVLSMGARIVAFPLACEIVQTFLNTSFEAGRHTARVEQISDIERREAEAHAG